MSGVAAIIAAGSSVATVGVFAILLARKRRLRYALAPPKQGSNASGRPVAHGTAENTEQTEGDQSLTKAEGTENDAASQPGVDSLAVVDNPREEAKVPGTNVSELAAPWPDEICRDDSGGTADTMRITKRTSGGRGEYEVSENAGNLHPRELIGLPITLQLAPTVKFPTGVTLWDRNGKRRLRMDPPAVNKIHLHRQVAAALLLPRPARSEGTWSADLPILKEGKYGIDNVDLFSASIISNTAVLSPGTITASNAAHQTFLSTAARILELQKAWVKADTFPVGISNLVRKHADIVQSGQVPGPELESLVSQIMSLLGDLAPYDGDPLAALLSLLQEGGGIPAKEPPANPKQSASIETESVCEAPAETMQVEELDLNEQAGHPQCHHQVDDTAISDDAIVSTATHLIPKPDAFSGAISEVPTLGKGHAADARHDAVPQKSEEISPEAHRRPRQYQAPGPLRRKQTDTISSTVAKLSAPRQPSELIGAIDVRVRRRRDNYAFSLLLQRRSGMPPSASAQGQNGTQVNLQCDGGDWYDDVTLSDLGAHLRTGIQWTSREGEISCRWSLAGREIYVFAPREGFSGLFSTTRLIIGEDHLVLCTVGLRDTVVSLLQDSTGQIPQAIDSNHGCPEGWCAFVDVKPARPIPESQAGDIFNVLRPRPDASLVLRGGLRLQYGQWLLGHPPQIILSGDVANAGLVFIDGKSAQVDAKGAYSALGWDAPGAHVVVCQSETRSYELVEPSSEWTGWDAHVFNHGHMSVCGASIRQQFTNTEQHTLEIRMIPISNPLLIGKEPGQIWQCSSGSQTPFHVAAVPFEPVWALPASPLSADKRVARVICLNPNPGINFTPRIWKVSRMPRRSLLPWISAILQSSRKGLKLENDAAEFVTAWNSYVQVAKTMWRGMP